MNYYGAREKYTTNDDGELVPSGFYHYTCKNDGRIWAIGDCRDGGTEHQHSSPEEACRCFKNYAIKTASLHIIDVKPHPDGAPRLCAVDECNEKACAVLRFRSGYLNKRILLCLHHYAEPGITKRMAPDVGSAISSW